MSFIKHINNSAATDQELLIQYRQNGDTRVLAELYQRYMDLLYGVCLKYLKQPETAQDAVMAIFEELILKLQKHEVTQFKGWVYRVAQNHCLIQLRSARNIYIIDPDLVQLTDDPHLNGVFEKEDNLNRLSECMETLSAEQKTSVELFYLKEKCYKEIADLTGSDWNKVRSLIQNGRRNLKICMEQKTKEDKLTNK
ncbi:MAG: sigma-70 family RNA polymerase sigma factor [Bacteroidota bacterium]|nr:sigma-70 family RNA polymerase sigma factor [Bacteroidota bacterium]MDP4213977.1 sigma-70 family RNA polymerase sigma factor [Bacteroidota bacterium]MDP4251327.1 sigma-70 family RNA polymerase sigma factor [Bacteroidota bacterium]